MSSSLILRIFRFNPASPVFDEAMRSILVPDLREVPGVVDAYGGRRDRGDHQRIIASIWTNRPAMVATVGTKLEESTFHPELLDSSTDRSLIVCPTSVVFQSPQPEEPMILRLGIGRVRPGELQAYVDEVREGTLQDAAAGAGPLALYLGCPSDEDFVTLSLWRQWSAIEAATGGNINNPRATRNSGRLLEWTVEHYERVFPFAAPD
ncbi:MAG TPA: hypothetical protein VGO64_11835 [Candidatus Limnocylindrales bacterium]|nr:hypothetical protein [Candidatus Limnocylindrales bacterium]